MHTYASTWGYWMRKAPTNSHSPNCCAVLPPLLVQVEMWVRAQRRVPHVLPGLHIEQGERVLVEISRKFTPEGGWADALVGLARRLEWLLSGCAQPSVLLGKQRT